MNRVLEYIIRAKDSTAQGISSALARVKGFAQKVVANLANVKAGFDMAFGVAQRFASLFAGAIREAFRFEKAHTDFAGLLNSIDKAKEHVADLRRFASSTPLTFSDLSQASKLMLSFGASVEDVMPTMKMLGDIAMGDRQKFQGLALVFAQVKSAGKLMGQDLLQMINQGFNPLTVIAQQTGKSVGELRDKMAKGAISFEMVAEAMRIATSEGGLFNNAMANVAKTGEGLMSTLQDKWTDAVRSFGEAFADSAKGGLQTLIDKLTELVEDGSVDEWANRMARGLASVVEVAQWCGKAISWLAEKYGAIRDWGERAGSAVGAWVGTRFNGGSARDSWLAGKEAIRQTRQEQSDRNAENAASDQEARRKGAERRASERERKSEQKEQERKTLQEMMAAQEAKALEEKRKKEEEIAKKAAEKRAAEEAKLRQREEQERKRMEQKIHAERIKLLEKELDLRKQDETDANALLEAAQQKTAQAWGWYRDKESMRAQIEEEKADAMAQRQFEKDFEKLRSRRRDWRTADNLSLDDEAVRRVGVAREEEAAAREYAKQTAEATSKAAETLEAVRAILEEGGAE